MPFLFILSPVKNNYKIEHPPKFFTLFTGIIGLFDDLLILYLLAIVCGKTWAGKGFVSPRYARRQSTLNNQLVPPWHMGKPQLAYYYSNYGGRNPKIIRRDSKFRSANSGKNNVNYQKNEGKGHEKHQNLRVTGINHG